jgi:cystathionine gamma-lyase
MQSSDAESPRSPRSPLEPRSPSRGFATRAIHAGSQWNRSTSLVPPIVQSSTFRLENAAQGAEFALSTAPADFYTRWGNPTLKQAEEVIASLEGSEAALLFASGMGAISAAILSNVRPGDHVLVGRSIYSGSHEIARHVLPDLGIETSFAEAGDLDAFAAALRPSTRVILVESPTNPTLGICDLEAIARLGREHGALTIVDNTFASPYNQNPIALGIDIVVHSGTKALNGHSDITCGVLCSRRDIVERAWGHLKIFGACLSPFEGWLLLRGLKTLALRAERQNSTALALARSLEQRPEVVRVHYPGLEKHPGHTIARRQMRGFGGILSVEIAGTTAEVARFAQSLTVISLAVSLGGAESLVQHPASMTHAMLTDDARRAAGIAPGLLRFSIGLEDLDDLRLDIENALSSYRSA